MTTSDTRGLAMTVGKSMSGVARKPAWLKVRMPGGETYNEVKSRLRDLKLHTVCEEARCPNVGECWCRGTATVMVLGDVCTRGCRFCAVHAGHPQPPDPDEPERVAQAVKGLGLRYVVLTMVNRDDMDDGGASHVAATIDRIHAADGILVEALVGDFKGNGRALDVVLASAPEVFAHNVEVVRRVTRAIRDVRCSYDRSIEVLRHAKAHPGTAFIKSGLMVGAGETDAEVEETLGDLRRAGVDMVTIGQYLRPSSKHWPVDRYVDPMTFERYHAVGMELGFSFVASGPLVRSSYRAAEGFAEAKKMRAR